MLVDKAGAPSTALIVAQPGPARSTPDYAALQVMNAALGGIFTSRINLNLREDKGYTYGAATGFTFRRGGGPFMARTTVRADVTGPALREIFREIERMAKEPPGADELEKARNANLLTLPAEFESNAATASAFAQIHVYGLEQDYYERLPRLLREVDARQIERVTRLYMTPGKMRVIAVGDRARVEPQLKELGLGPVEIRSAQEQASR